MIASSTLDGLMHEVMEARYLASQLRQVRAMQPGGLLTMTSGVTVSDPGEIADYSTPVGLTLPAGMVADGLVQQLHLAAHRLAAGGILFDEADPADLPKPPAKRGRRPASPLPAGAP